jgi:hypothetical protein
LAFALTVIAVGATLRTEPAVGEVLTTDVAYAGEIEIIVRNRAVTNCILRFMNPPLPLS